VEGQQVEGGSSDRGAPAHLGIRLLGPVEVTMGGQPCPFPKLTHRILLAILVSAGGRVVPASSLIEELWQEDSSPRRRKNLQTHVYQLRRVLRGFEPGRAADRILTQPPGYQLSVTDCELDLHALDGLVAAAREAARDGDLSQARSLYQRAPLSVKLV
jgi:DNA-binding SARP family transcriptional activator